MHFLRSAFGIALLLAGAGCYGGAPSPPPAEGYAGSGGYAGSVTEEDGATDGGAPAMLAFVDTGRTLSATPGQGVGVFVTYSAGGNWLVQWTCDTSITGESCPFQITVSTVNPSAPIALQSDNLAAGARVTAVAPSAVQTGLTIETTTTTEGDNASFLTSAGAAISVGVELDGLPSSQYFFFVQNGQVNGGYTGAFSDPMEFSPTSP
jgi:hypothetical protein